MIGDDQPTPPLLLTFDEQEIAELLVIGEDQPTPPLLLTFDEQEVAELLVIGEDQPTPPSLLTFDEREVAELLVIGEDQPTPPSLLTFDEQEVAELLVVGEDRRAGQRRPKDGHVLLRKDRQSDKEARAQLARERTSGLPGECGETKACQIKAAQADGAT